MIHLMHMVHCAYDSSCTCGLPCVFSAYGSSYVCGSPSMFSECSSFVHLARSEIFFYFHQSMGLA